LARLAEKPDLTMRARAAELAGRGVHVPHGHSKTLTFMAGLAGLRHDRIVAPSVLDGPINGAAFTAWVGPCLVPALIPADIIISDNLGSRKGRRARQMIGDAKTHLLFLLPYSTDLNPTYLRRKNGPRGRLLILLILAKLKTLFRKADERTIEDAWRRVGNLLDAFSPD
jgi:transposase